MDRQLTATIRDAMPLAALLGFEAVEGGPDGVVLRGRLDAGALYRRGRPPRGRHRP